MDDEASGVVIELAKELIKLIRGIEPKWRNAYYRFDWEPGRYGGTGSYTFDSKITLIDALTYSPFFKSMNEKGKKLSTLLKEQKGVLLLVADSNFDYEIKFDFKDMGRWEISKMDGGTGIPAGL